MAQREYPVKDHEKEHRTILKNIARRAMFEKGLLPDFSNIVLAELERIQAPVSQNSKEFRDQKDLLWASIDNDDSLDLDQLTAVESNPARGSKFGLPLLMWILLSKKGPRSTIMPAIIPPRYILRQRFFRCCLKGFRTISPH